MLSIHGNTFKFDWLSHNCSGPNQLRQTCSDYKHLENQIEFEIKIQNPSM